MRVRALKLLTFGLMLQAKWRYCNFSVDIHIEKHAPAPDPCQPSFTAWRASDFVSEEHAWINKRPTRPKAHFCLALYFHHRKASSRNLTKTSAEVSILDDMVTSGHGTKHVNDATYKDLLNDFISKHEDSSDDDYSEGSSPSERRLKKAPSSRSIPIPRPATKTSFDENEEDRERKAQAERRYELATWKMYELIVSYRQKNPFGQQYSPKDLSLFNKDVSRAKERQGLDLHELPKDDRILDGEIFEMDL